MTDTDRDDIIFELHLAEGDADRNETLVRFVRAYPTIREDLVDHWCEIVLMGLRAAAHPDAASEPATPAIIEGAWRRFFVGTRPIPAVGCAVCFDQPAPALECPVCRGSGDPCRPWRKADAIGLGTANGG